MVGLRPLQGALLVEALAHAVLSCSDIPGLQAEMHLGFNIAALK